MSLKIGDKIQVLDDNFEGIVRQINGDEIQVETPDGFLMPYSSKEVIKISHQEVELRDVRFNSENVRESKSDQPLPRKNVVRVKGEIPPPEYDLHIEKLHKNHKHLQPYDIILLQLDTAQYQIEQAIKKRKPKIVLIHGVGDGRLREELEYMVRRYEEASFRDGNYQKYGQGAIEVSFNYNL